MEYRRLGKSGLKVSALSFGTWVTFGGQVDLALAEDCMKTAYDKGVNFFDNAEAYNKGVSETIMGKTLKKLDWRRDSYCVSSKVYFGSVPDPKPTQHGLCRKHIVDACDQALERLQVDYLDLYFCHRPDSEVPIEETVRTMHNLIQQGKILYWGTSEWSAQEIMEAYGVARQYNLVPPTMEQPEYNLLHRTRIEEEYARLYEEIGLGTTIWSPLASGMLTGKYNEGTPADARINLPGYEWLKERFESEQGRQKLEKVKQLGAIADELGISITLMALAWCLKNPNVSTVMLGASKVEQLDENLKALNVVKKLTNDVMEKIEGVLA